MRSAYDVIIKPVISEQSMDQAQEKKYTFKVAVDANKTEVKLAVEEIFGVEVKKVNIMNIDGKIIIRLFRKLTIIFAIKLLPHSILALLYHGGRYPSFPMT